MLYTSVKTVSRKPLLQSKPSYPEIVIYREFGILAKLFLFYIHLYDFCRTAQGPLKIADFYFWVVCAVIPNTLAGSYARYIPTDSLFN